MAVLKSKQLTPNLTGSYILSGSSQTLHGTTTIHGTTTVSGSLTLKGSSVDLNIRQDDNTNIARLSTTTAGESTLKLYDNANHGSAVETININTSDANALTIKSGSTTIFTVDRDNAIISASGGEIHAQTILLDTAVKYTDAGGDNRYALLFPGSDVVAVTNRASNGVVQVRANDGTDGSGGEHIVAQFDDEKVNIGNAIYLASGSGHVTASGDINTTAGRIFEQGTSVIDHATAMAIVFGG